VNRKKGEKKNKPQGKMNQKKTSETPQNTNGEISGGGQLKKVEEDHNATGRTEESISVKEKEYTKQSYTGNGQKNDRRSKDYASISSKKNKGLGGKNKGGG